MNKRNAFSVIDLLLGAVVIFALFMYFLPSLKNYSRRPIDNSAPSVEEQVDQQIHDVQKLRQEAEDQNRRILEQMNY